MATEIGSMLEDSDVESFFLQYYPWLVTLMMGAALAFYLPRYFYEGYTGRYFLNLHRSEPQEAIHFMRFAHRPLRACAWVLMLFVLSRALWLGGVQVYLMLRDSSLTSENIYYYINKWDAVNYTRIAQYGYGFDNHGIKDYVQEYTIAFMPGYPLLIGLLNILVNDYVLSGLILSNLMTIGSGIILYSLVSDMYNEAAARRSCFFFLFSAAAGVFSATHSESTLFFFTLLAIYLARHRRFILAVAAGAFACFTRQFGMFAAIPVFYEMLRSLERYPTGSEIIMRERADMGAAQSDIGFAERVGSSVRLHNVWKYVLLAACILTGYGAYLFINYRLYGNPLAFLQYQQLNWHNQLVPIWDCIGINTQSLLASAGRPAETQNMMGIFLPQQLMAFILPLMMLCFIRRGDAGDNAYMWCYTLLTFSSSWLISGIRYIAAMYPLYIMLGLMSARKAPRSILYAAAVGVFLYYNIMYSVNALVV